MRCAPVSLKKSQTIAELRMKKDKESQQIIRARVPIICQEEDPVKLSDNEDNGPREHPAPNTDWNPYPDTSCDQGCACQQGVRGKRESSFHRGRRFVDEEER